MAEQKKPRNFRESKAFRALKQGLMDDLSARGLDRAVFIDKVEEYMDLWVRWKTLNEDADLRGLTVTDDRGRQTANPSISLSFQASKQMLALFNALGFKPGDVTGIGGDDVL